MSGGVGPSGGIVRGSGVLMPLFSLPSPHGIGTMGKEAYDFIDFLHAAGQKYWQMLPIGPTGYGDSPYQSFSAHAGNPYFIDLDLLVAQGLLSPTDLSASGLTDQPGTIDYGNLYAHRFGLLRKAVEAIAPDDEAFRAFCKENAYWLKEYALFMSLKEAFGMTPCQQWPGKLRRREKVALWFAEEKFAREIHVWSCLQFLFFEQWEKLKTYANRRNIRIIGDIPIYVAPDSSDLWAHPKLFQLNRSGWISAVAGCPPDYFNADGQLWGNPLYRWKAHKETHFDWWTSRLRHARVLFDAVRIDHFRGFSSYYAIPVDSETAATGAWKRGPGRDFVDAVQRALPKYMIIAEDLGFLTAEVRWLLESSGFPGMKVLQFAFDADGDNEYLPHHYKRNSVVYTGTHDNPTTPEWERTATAAEINFAREYLGVAESASLTEAMIRSCMASVSAICIIPIQDWLGLGGEARINKPASAEGNWCFRMTSGMLTEALRDKIERMTRHCGR